MYYSQQPKWLAQAERLKPTLSGELRRPSALVRAVKDRQAFQGWRLEKSGAPRSLNSRMLDTGASFILDFGEHLVGHLSFTAQPGGPQDAPVRLRLTFAETPAETGESFDPHRSWLCRAWLQDETVNLDTLPARICLPRRYAFRYVKVEALAVSRHHRLKLCDFACQTVNSAGKATPPPRGLSQKVRALDTVSLNTLRNCMQTVFEDGPKRDQRLWLGDLRLQALVNYASFRNYALVKRCLYLFAGLARPDGTVPSCLHEAPRPHAGASFILDYTALFAPVLLEYAQASGDWAAARELWPVARRQMEFALSFLGPDAVFFVPKQKMWLFIDWQPKLDRQAAMQGVFVLGLKSLLALAGKLKKEREVRHFAALLPRMLAGARKTLWDPRLNLAVSGAERQVSAASQAWLIIAGVLTPVEGRAALKALARHRKALAPVSPYLWHCLVEALLICGLEKEAVRLLGDYWGAMLARGATTFWEVFDPKQPKLSPYNSHLINSYCHAWSCTPAYFIRRRPEIF